MNAPAPASIPAATPPSPDDHAPPGELALQLGYAGLIPFVGGTLFVWLLAGRIENDPFYFLVNAFTGYAALIVSFLGGMPWGLVMRDVGQTHERARRALWVGITYSLLAWVAVCMPPCGPGRAGRAAGGLLPERPQALPSAGSEWLAAIALSPHGGGQPELLPGCRPDLTWLQASTPT